MRIFYDKKGNIIGTVEGFSDNPDLDKVRIIPSGMREKDIRVENICLGHKQEKIVREFEDVTNPKQVLEYKVIIKNNKFNGFKKL